MCARAVVLIGVQALVFAAIGSLFGPVWSAAALAAGVFVSFWSFWSAGPRLLQQLDAVLCRREELTKATAELADRAGIPPPRLFEVEDDELNALAIGPTPESSVIILTSGLLARLSVPELRGVLAHEIAHIRNRDILACTIAATLVNAIASLATALALVGLGMRRRGGGVIIALAIIAPLIALIVRLAISRSIEYRADRDGAILCDGPEGIIGALQKIQNDTDAKQSTQGVLCPELTPLLFVDSSSQSWLAALRSAHPPTHKRIAKLQASVARFRGAYDLLSIRYHHDDTV